MAKSNYGLILLLDNDVMVYLFRDLYDIDKNILNKVVSFLALTYSRIWIPQVVREEFLLKNKNKQRSKRLDKILDNFAFISPCPIPVSQTEIITLIGNTEENAGEADAILQAQKAKTFQNLFFNDIVFLSNDKGGQRLAKDFDISVLKYKDLKIQLNEAGIIIPI